MIIRKALLSIGAYILPLFLIIFYFVEFSMAQSISENAPKRSIHGRVISQYGPVENARVRIAGEEKYTLTDRLGGFTLQTGHRPAASLKVTAGKEGWFNNGQIAYPVGRVRDIFLNPVYLGDRPYYRFVSPVTCSRCHVKLTRYWDKSKMAHTTSNPKVLDMYYGTDAFKRSGVDPGYKLDNPQNNGNCVTCHAPSVAASGNRSQDLKTALWSPRTEWDGISCDYCHKVRKVIRTKSTPSGWSPIMERQTPSRGNSILVFGPYDDVVNPPMAASYSPIFDKGQFCATCHSHIKKLGKEKIWDRTSIYTDAEWNGFGLEDNTYLPVQTTYQEWKHWQDQLPSDDANKGKKCQDCHMSWRKEMLPYDNYVIDGQARQMWGTKRSPRNIRPHHFDGGTETQLKTALAMEIEGEITDKVFNIRVYITNTNGGHWVPTGETMRSVMLVINAEDSKGKPLEMIKGKRLPQWAGIGRSEVGNYAGMPGAVFARVLKDERGNINVPFWQAAGIAIDTRIRPKTTIELEYQFALDDPDDEPTAEARLIYRPVIKPLANFKNWTVQDIQITSSVW